MTAPKRTEPSWSILHQPELYTNSVNTNIAARFARIKAEKPVQLVRRKK